MWDKGMCFFHSGGEKLESSGGHRKTRMGITENIPLDYSFSSV